MHEIETMAAGTLADFGALRNYTWLMAYGKIYTAKMTQKKFGINFEPECVITPLEMSHFKKLNAA